MRILIAAIFAGLALVAPALAQDDPDLAQGREASQAFLSGDLEPIWAAMTPEMQAVFGDAAGLATFHETVTASLGAETVVDDETVETSGDGVTTYSRTARWSAGTGPILMQWSFDAAGRIAAFGVRAVPVLAESRFLDYQTKARLRLPFAGEWMVVWGGRTLEQNYHAADRAQRFALDFLIVRDGATHAGDPAAMESYHCWDQPILAPAPAIVVAAVGDLPDNAIGETDTANPVGNHVVLDLGNSEYLFLAHFREGSLKVEPGSTVLPGEELGRCGNSGNTSEPHLHLHLQTTADLATGEGLPAQFESYRTADTSVARGEPLQGETVSHAGR